MPRIALAVLLALVAAPVTGSADNAFGDDEVVVAVIDSGVRPTHQEFDYGGPGDPDDQFVAWWDFTDTVRGSIRKPRLGERWDPDVADPYDNVGHGTLVSSLAVGRNVGTPEQQRPSFFPGGKLAVARVCASTGCGGDIAAAIRWASGTVEADVITISIALFYPLPELIIRMHEAIRLARERGTLVVVANSNGLLGVVGPEPGYATPMASSTAALSVGASGQSGARSATDPEVVSDFAGVRTASADCDTCYEQNSGTSLGTPLVAGLAARALAEGLANGHDYDPDHLEALLKYSAVDTEYPPTLEGYGVLDEAALPTLLDNAAAGTLPARPTPDANALYVDGVMGALRDVNSNKADGDVWGYRALPVEATTPPYVLQRGVAPGIVEGETFPVDLAAGEELFVWASSIANFSRQPFDLFLFRGDGTDALLGRDLVDNARHGEPVLAFRAQTPGRYTVLLVGRLVNVALPYQIGSESSVRGPDVLGQPDQHVFLASKIDEF